MSDALAELRAQEEQRQRQAQAPAPVARPTLPPRTPIEPAIARQGKNQWPSIARALVAGEFPSLVRRNFNFNTRQ
jgi:hypothetical protein